MCDSWITLRKFVIRLSYWFWEFLEQAKLFKGPLVFYTIQEAMESSAFPNRIKMKVKMYKLLNIFISPKITQKRSKLYVFSLET